MPIDRSAAENFIWYTARLVDRHRYALLFEDGPAQAVVETLRGYRNPDGGIGHALEPDLRCPSSQPASRLCALEMLGSRRSSLDRVDAEPDGGIPMVLPGFESYPHSPWMAPEPGSFLTLALAAALHARGVGDGEWLVRATEWCWSSIEANEQPGGYWLEFACRFLDAVPDGQRARAAMDSLAARIDTSAFAPADGVEGEQLRPLDISPRPGSRSRRLFSEEQIEADLDAVEAEQKQDGGWMFDWLTWSPAQTNDWRGTVTIRALTWLRANGRVGTGCTRRLESEAARLDKTTLGPR
jgi:hypothetical protein